MIQPHELRIGNCLQRLDGSILYVTAQDILTISEWDKSKGLLPKPIPLTEEWLINFGFENDGHNDWKIADRLKMEYVFQIREDLEGNVSSCGVMGISFLDTVQNFAWNIKYVHQLMNLHFSITGTELPLTDKTQHQNK